MSDVSITPTNKNFLSPLGFRFFVKKLPNVNFFVQSVNIPGLRMGDTPEQPTPFVAIPQSGDHLLYNELNVTFRVDENLQNYLEIHNWLRGLGFPDNFGEYTAITKEERALGGGIKSDAQVVITTNGMSPNFLVNYQDVFPVALTDLQFNSTDSDVSYIEATAQFRYTQYTIESVY